jgi:hypothetical protein
LVFLGLLLLMLLSALSIAQTTTSGGLTGVVTDPSGAVIPNADVEIKNTSKSTTQSAITDREGGYRFFFLAPARYMLTVAHAGFETEKRAVDVLLLGIGFQFFSLFNHTNFGGSDNYMSNPTFGEIFYLTQPPTGILGGSAPHRE